MLRREGRRFGYSITRYWAWVYIGHVQFTVDRRNSLWTCEHVKWSRGHTWRLGPFEIYTRRRG